MNTCWRNWRTFGTPSSISWKRSPPSADVILRLDAYRFLARQVFKEQLGRRNGETGIPLERRPPCVVVCYCVLNVHRSCCSGVQGATKAATLA